MQFYLLNFVYYQLFIMGMNFLMQKLRRFFGVIISNVHSDTVFLPLSDRGT